MILFAYHILIGACLALAQFVIGGDVRFLYVGLGSLSFSGYLLWYVAREHIAETAERLAIDKDIEWLREIKSATEADRKFWEETRLSIRVIPNPGKAKLDFYGIPNHFIREFFVDAINKHNGDYLPAIRTYYNLAGVPRRDWARKITEVLYRLGEVQWSTGSRPAKVLTSLDSCWDSIVPKVPEYPHRIIING